MQPPALSPVISPAEDATADRPVVECRFCHRPALPAVSDRKQYRMWACAQCGHRIYQIIVGTWVIRNGTGQ